MRMCKTLLVQVLYYICTSGDMDKKTVPQRFSADLFSSPGPSSGLSFGLDANFSSPFSLVATTKKEDGKHFGCALIRIITKYALHQKIYKLLKVLPGPRHSEVPQLLGAPLVIMISFLRGRPLPEMTSNL